MKVVGRVADLSRYPVKSMRGEQMTRVFVGFSGVYGDRWYSISNTGAIQAFPYLTARERESLLLFVPAYRHPNQMVQPPNLEDAESLGPGVTPLYLEGDDRGVDVTTPAGEKMALEDPRLLDLLREGLPEKWQIGVRYSHRSMTDCRPISLISVQTGRQLCAEAGVPVDLRRFRANLYIDLDGDTAFAENSWVGRTLRIGEKASITVVDRDPRCKMITLDPETGKADPEMMRVVAKQYEGKAGLYGAVLVEGIIQTGDPIWLSA